MTSPESIPPVPDALAARLRELAGLDAVAGVAVTVVREGQAIGFWSAGYASLPFRVPVTEHTLFHIGSVGKHITALAVMQLVDAGSVVPDASVGSYVQGLPNSWAAISVRRLLTHTSGLPDYGRVIRDWDRPQSRELIINADRDRAAVVRSRHRLGLQQHQLRGAGMVDRSPQRTVVCRLPASSGAWPGGIAVRAGRQRRRRDPGSRRALRPYQQPLRACRAVGAIGIRRGRWRRPVLRPRHRALVGGARRRAPREPDAHERRQRRARC